MKRLLLLFLHFPLIVSSQIIYDFESGLPETWEQSRDSAWCTTDAGTLSGSFSLWHRLDDSIAGEDRISFTYDSLVMDGAKTTWQFKLKHAYLPSSSNKWAVFLLCDQDEKQMRPGGQANAIILGVNFNGSDDFLKLWKMSYGNLEVIAETSMNWQEEVGTGAARLKAERDPAGEWKIFIGSDQNLPDDDEYEPVWKLIGEGRDTISVSPEYFGIYYRFSSKQDMKLWVDDIYVSGSFLRDTTPPSAMELKVLNERTLRIFFSEALDREYAMVSERYSIIGRGVQPDSILLHRDNTLDLVFREPFVSGISQTIRIKGLSDQHGNVSGAMEYEFTWFRAVPGDLVINELLYDPEPVIGLPGLEFVEVYNRSGFTVSMEGWIIRTGTKQITLPEYEFPAGEYLLLCYKGSGNLYPYAVHLLEALGSRTIFSNEGAVVYLFDRDSVLIDWMDYTPEMHEDEYYAGGGWSLELKDPSRHCHSRDNWTSSMDKRGGSPGQENPVMRINPDQDPPEILSVFLPDSLNLVIKFNESMDAQSLICGEAGYGRMDEYDDFSQGNIWKIEPGSSIPDSIIMNNPFVDQVNLVFGEGFEAGQLYYLELDPGIRDCSGNAITPGIRYRFALPLKPERSEILLSEVLFNPMPFCPDFVEIYNPGPETFDLADVTLAGRDHETNLITSAVRILTGHRLFFPEEYLVLTEDPQTLAGCYTVCDPDVLIKVRDMPSMGDDEGSVLLLDKYLEMIDEFRYDKDMHHPGLPSVEGVSLERISFLSPSENRSNWHSASSNDGYGTPGRQNSQFGETSIPLEGFELEPEIFSPDMDGENDILFIKYHFNSPGLTARILVFDPKGRLVKDIAGTQLLGREGFFTWNGTDRYGKTARAGIYLMYAEIYGKAEGNRKFKKSFVLSTGR